MASADYWLENGPRVYFPVFLLDIRDGKVWVQEDATDVNLVDQLQQQGIPKTDVLLAFMALYKQSFSGYAIA